MADLSPLTLAMTTYYAGDPKRIQHFLKVHALAALIGRREGLAEDVQELLEAASLVHDIGIKPAEEKYGRCDGRLQEQEGPAPARAMLENLGFSPAAIQRICYLVGHHHTYTNIDGPDYQILVEADFLVNLYEEQVREAGIRHAYNRIFRTQAGKHLCRIMYGLEPADSL